MRYPAWSPSRGIWQDHDCRRRKEIPNFIFRNIALELDAGAIFPALAKRLDVARTHGVVRARYDQLGVWEATGDLRKSFNQNFWPLISSPFAESKNPVLWIPAFADVWKLRRGGKDSVFPQMNVLPAVI